MRRHFKFLLSGFVLWFCPLFPLVWQLLAPFPKTIFTTRLFHNPLFERNLLHPSHFRPKHKTADSSHRGKDIFQNYDLIKPKTQISMNPNRTPNPTHEPKNGTVDLQALTHGGFKGIMRENFSRGSNLNLNPNPNPPLRSPLVAAKSRHRQDDGGSGLREGGFLFVPVQVLWFRFAALRLCNFAFNPHRSQSR
jgi:hypothetical protein